MSGHGYVRHGGTQLEWNEAKNRMVIFGRQELVLRYPEVR